MIALYDMKGQEVYDLSGRQLSHFNDRALAGKYVAKPEPLLVERAGYDVHGFVLKPTKKSVTWRRSNSEIRS